MRLLGYRRCPACHRPFDTAPVFKLDNGYCCSACANNGMCDCFSEEDRAEDGVDSLGLLAPYAERTAVRRNDLSRYPLLLGTDAPDRP
jgi:hypothetical protein